MRQRVRALSVVGVLVLAGLAGVTRHPARAVAGPVITDPAGDATQFVLDVDPVPVPSEPSLDILSADFAIGTDLTTTVTVASLPLTPPPGGTGRVFRFYFTYGGMEFQTRATQAADGTATFRLYDPSNTSVACAACTGSLDTATATVTVHIPMSVLNDSIDALSGGAIPAIGPGARIVRLNVFAQRLLAVPGAPGVTPTADTADTDRTYIVGSLPAPPSGSANPDEKGDAVVIAVIDNNMSPYHWDFDAKYMPQHLDTDPANDLPLTAPPDSWLPGFPSPSSFHSYSSLPLTLASTDPEAKLADLNTTDAAVWNSVPKSTATEVNYRWIPGTKVIGAVDFGGSKIKGTGADHGLGVTSVSVGNLHGTCPECLLVFVNIASPPSNAPGVLNRASVEAAVAWATSQPWIDVITDSWGLHLIGGDVRDNLYGQTQSVAHTKTATERGQTIFFSAGNGIENSFIVPNTTYFNAMKGPDWIVTVGAITPPPDDANYSGAGKPVDVAGIGDLYPSAYSAVRVSGTGPTGFSGTSNATPTVAGLYGRALYQARADLTGPSRTQVGGVIATGSPFACGAARPACELGDGELTAAELRTRLVEGAVHTSGGTSVGGLQDLPPVADEQYASEGHGAYMARQKGIDALWLAEHERIVGPLEGRVAAATRPAGEREWMIVDSFCRQHLWGAWGGGYYHDATTTPLPGANPAYPIRSAIELACPALTVPPTP